MPTAHWLQSRFSSTGFSVWNNIPLPTITIPAGGRLVRFISNGLQMRANETGVGGTAIFLYDLEVTLSITSGHYSPRQLFYGTYRFDQNVTALYDSATFQRIYSNWLQIGDQDVKINQRCSYGGNGIGSFVITPTVKVITQPFTLTPPTGAQDVGFQFLYLL